jgi:hypothetical protein
MHKEDKDVFGKLRSCATGGCPAVFVLNEPHTKVEITRDWQFYLVAMNYDMTLENVSLLLHYHLAFCNNTGFGKEGEPRRDYILNKNLTARELPRFDKDRTCSRNTLTGTVVGDKLRLKLFDGNKPPPMKPGRPLPRNLADVRFEDYLYNPRDNREMFIVANRVTTKPGGQSSVAPFPRGGYYPWTGDDKQYSFLPHISDEVIDYPLQYLQKTTGINSPYRIITTTLAIKNLLMGMIAKRFQTPPG